MFLLLVVASLAQAQPVPEPQMIDVVGDLQRTSIAEQVFMSRDQNDAARLKIIDAISRDTADLLLLLGDQVSAGDDPVEWQFFDSVMKPITDAHIPIRACLGNHEYAIVDKAMGVRESARRFPSSRRWPYVEIFGRIALITFNSNLTELTEREARKQAEDYLTALRRLDADPAVAFVIVAGHHPPYTNSDLGGDPDVEAQFAVPFLESRKGRLFLSGHVHSYERFVVGDKMFVITGGGGGPRRPVNTSSSRPYQNDAFRQRGSGERVVRPFNFLRLYVNNEEVLGKVMMLRGDHFVAADTFELPFAESAVTAEGR